MARTKGDCKALFLRLLDEATKKGVAIPVTKNADYTDKCNYFLHDAQVYVAQQVKIASVYNVTQNPIPNQLGEGSGFEMRQYLPSTPIVLTATGTKSYYIEMDNVGTCTIAVNGGTVRLISNTTKKAFTAYKGNTGATDTDTVTITFSGSYPYNIRNTAMFAYAFPESTDVPNYTPFAYLLSYKEHLLQQYYQHHLHQHFQQIQILFLQHQLQHYKVLSQMVLLEQLPHLQRPHHLLYIRPILHHHQLQQLQQKVVVKLQKYQNS
jgi:hypothetical protein